MNDFCAAEIVNVDDFCKIMCAGTRAVRRIGTRTDTAGQWQRTKHNRDQRDSTTRKSHRQSIITSRGLLLLLLLLLQSPDSSYIPCNRHWSVSSLACTVISVHQTTVQLASAEDERQRPTLEHLIEGPREDNFTLLEDEFGNEEPKEELFRGVTKDTGLSYAEFEYYFPDVTHHDRMNNVYVLFSQIRVRCFPSSFFFPALLGIALFIRSASNISFAILLLFQFHRRSDCGFGPSRL